MSAEKKILVVEDEGIVALDIQMRLEHMGYSICGIAATGQDAIDKANSAQPNLVLMDINLKGNMSGIEAAEEIRREQNIPIIYLTANTDENTLNHAKLTAPYGYIMKPFNERALYATIESALQRFIDEQETLSRSKEQYQSTLQKYEQQFAILNKLDEQIADSLDIDYVLTKVLETAIQLSGANRGYAGIIKDGKWQQLKTENYPIGEVSQALQVSSNVMRVIHLQEAAFIPDVQNANLDPSQNIHRHSQIIIPFIARGTLFGILNLETNETEIFTQQIFEIMKMIVTRISVAIDNARLYRQSQNQINQLRNLHRELLDFSYHDTLTQLPNRRKFEEFVDSLLERYHQTADDFAILSIDLDGFKTINDNYGHPIGDVVLREIANRLKNVIGRRGLLARIGGDEFVIIQLLSDNHMTIAQFAESVIAVVGIPIQVDDYVLQVGASIGICVSPLDGTDRIDLIRRADRALYHAKETGKNRHSFYNPSLSSNLSDISISQQLQSILERDELRLYYQPIIDGRTKQIIGAEALLRWQHPEWGMVMPDQFIPIAVNNMMIVPITNWLIMTACKQHKLWREAGHDLFVSVNVTALQLSSEFIKNISHTLLLNKMDPKWLKIEITEDIALNGDESHKYLHELSELGIGIAIDDFGKGYSSLDYLRNQYISVIKIDKLLTQGISSNLDTTQRSQSIIKAINELAHQLGIKVVVEGVETEEQFAFVDEIGCDLAQGYLIGKPMIPADLLTTLEFTNA